MKRQRGLSFLDFLIVATVVGALVRLSVPNFYEFRKRAADASAYSVYSEVRGIFENTSNSGGATPTALIFNQRGPGLLPSPFQKVSLSQHITVNYVINLHYPGFIDITAVEVSHDLGEHYYRMISINGKKIEQILKR